MSEYDVKKYIRRKLDAMHNLQVLKDLAESTGNVEYGALAGMNYVIHLGEMHNIRVEIPITNILKCQNDDELQALIETQYAIALLKGEKR